MAFKLPFFSKGNKEELAGKKGVSERAAGMSKGAGAMSRTIGGHTDTISQDATFIGDVLQKSGDIRLPLIGKLPLQEQIRILSLLLGGSFVLGIAFVLLNSAHSELTSTRTQIAGNALMHSQRIGKATPNAIQGNVKAFDQLQDSRKKLNDDLAVLMKGGSYEGHDISAPNAAMAEIIADTQKAWASSDHAAETVIKLKDELTGFGATLEKMNPRSSFKVGFKEHSTGAESAAPAARRRRRFHAARRGLGRSFSCPGVRSLRTSHASMPPPAR